MKKSKNIKENKNIVLNVRFTIYLKFYDYFVKQINLVLFSHTDTSYKQTKMSSYTRQQSTPK